MLSLLKSLTRGPKLLDSMECVFIYIGSKLVGWGFKQLICYNETNLIEEPSLDIYRL